MSPIMVEIKHFFIAILFWFILLLPFILLAVGSIFYRFKWSRILRVWGIRSLIVYVLLIASVYIYFTISTSKAIRNLEDNCKLHLKHLAKIQEDFKIEFDRYGTWQELKEYGYIDQDSKSIYEIRQYELAVFTPDESTTNEEKINGNTFNIVALPDDRSPHYALKTFAICEGNLIRYWDGPQNQFDLNSLDLHDETNWKPLR